ncbi:MAG: hypothetical protein FJY91_00940 [Candidatus Harrisonbacteria bacterium]|nr:hypothetical protein [Candidatus Harrisonbacteria bacterium]
MDRETQFIEIATRIHGEAFFCNQAEMKALERLYNQPHRLYHDTTHIISCLRHDRDYRSACQGNKGWAEEWRPVSFALLFHDAVYVPDAKDNEERSADMAERYLQARLAEKREGNIITPDKDIFIAEVKRLILLTKDYFQIFDPSDENGKVMLDIDLAVFNAPEEEFDQYERGIRAEWRGVFASEGDYLRKRIEFLERMQKLRPFYRTQYFQHQNPKLVQSNIVRSIWWLHEQLDLL